MVIQYKCPNCGADMEYDSISGTLHCDSCGRKEDIDHMPIPDIQEGSSNDAPNVNNFDTSEIKDEASFDYNDTYDETLHRTFKEGEATQYQCNNCGAVVLTDSNTTATTCSFCGAAVVLGDRLTGALQPARIIPFKINKSQAQQAFIKWCKGGKLTPPGFMTADRIKNITGIYVPFWLYDVNGSGDIDATCTRVRTYTSGDYIYTETKYYHVYRKVNLNYLNIPVDASSKMSDLLMDLIEPYNYQELKTFQMPYLAGYIAEKYNYTDKDMYTRAKDKANSYVDSYLRNTINSYSSVVYNRKDIQVKQRKAYYTLLPVWMVCYDYKDSEHIFAMNGQTGKIVGKPPLSNKKIATWFAFISGISFIIFKIIAIMLGGSLL